MDRPVRVALIAVAVFLVGGATLGAAGVLPVPFPGDCPTGPGESAPQTTAAGGTVTRTTATATTTATTRPEDGYARTTVIAYDEDGRRLGTVRVRIAESHRQKYVGLSETESLAEDEGMLFPYDSEGSHTYVMRGMSFGIDIVYVDADGYVTRIHHAPEPPEGVDGNSCRYPGRGQYVLEVTYNWTVRHGVDAGDRLYIEGYEEWPRNASGEDEVSPGSLPSSLPESVAGLSFPGKVRATAQC